MLTSLAAGAGAGAKTARVIAKTANSAPEKAVLKCIDLTPAFLIKFLYINDPSFLNIDAASFDLTHRQAITT